MTRELRTIHRFATAALAVALPALLVAAFAARRAVPVSAPVPGARAVEIPTGAYPVLDDRALWRGSEIRTMVWRPRDGATDVLSLDPSAESVPPDSLLYWGVAADGLPSDAVLLGRLEGSGRSLFALPAAASRGGRLYLFSLAHYEVVAIADLPTLSRGAR